MVFSFKVSKTGTRFRSKPFVQSDTVLDEVSENSEESSVIGSKNESSTRKGEVILATWLLFSIEEQNIEWELK